MTPLWNDPGKSETGKNDLTAASSAPAKTSGELGQDWDTLRGLTKNTYQKSRPPRALAVLLVLSLVVALAAGAWLLYGHWSAVSGFADKVGEAIYTFITNPPKPSPPAPDTDTSALPSRHVKPRLSRSRVSDAEIPKSQPDELSDLLPRPFIATALVGGRKLYLVSKNRMVILDVASGTWKIASEVE
jgi:hypothetical protein